MTRPDGRLLQVALTGTRLVPCRDEELLLRLQTKFKLSEAQGAAMLKGRCIVKRGIDPAVAEKFIAALEELGLQAVVEEMPPPTVSSHEKPPAVPQRAARPDTPSATSAAPPFPGPAASAAPRPGPATPNAALPLDALRSLANQRLPRPRTSFSYLIGLLLVTLLCVALPAIYVGLTGGIAFTWIWYLTHIHEHLADAGSVPSPLSIGARRAREPV